MYWSTKDEMDSNYSSGPDSGTPAMWDFPESGTEKGVRDF